MMGISQWVVSFEKSSLCFAIMTMPYVHMAACKSYVSCIKHIFDYLARNPDGVICVRTNKPDYSDIQDIVYDWEYSVYVMSVN